MADAQPNSQFHNFDIDERILKGIAKLGWRRPTMVQDKAIPFIMDGKDVLIRARTGSGKTGAYSIPVIQNILKLKADPNHKNAVHCVILAPSKELCHQIKGVIDDLTIKCRASVQIVDLSLDTEQTTLDDSMLSDIPDIVVATPSRILSYIKRKSIKLKKSVKTVIVDEADLMFSFGFKEDLQTVLDALPSNYQAVLAAATLSLDILELKSILLHKPVIIKFEESDIPAESQLKQYKLMAEEEDKAAIIYVLLKLHLIRGKTIIFVNSVDKCYKLKLFLDQFQILTCVLNSELPVNIRCHTVLQFNESVYDILIASDDKALVAQGKKSSRKDKEFGVSRGIDFQNISNVINFDFPMDANSYMHRAGRTARGNNTGNVLSFVNCLEKPILDQVNDLLSAQQHEDETIIKDYQLDMQDVEAFRYRARDAWRAIIKTSIRDARLKEIKTELFNSEKLKGYFDENPRDLQVLRHDRVLHTVKTPRYLSDVPEYIVPNALKNVAGIIDLPKRRKRAPAETKSKYDLMKEDPLKCVSIDYNKKKRRFK